MLPPLRTLLPVICLTMLLQGCLATSPILSVAGVALEAIGLKKGEKKPFEVSLTIQPGSNLNASGSSGAAALTKIYHLNNAESWSRLSMEQLFSDEATKSALGGDLISSREVTLIPRQNYTVTETVDPQTKYLAVATFFHTAATDRWKYVFDAKEAEKTGIMIGAHSCALTVTAGVPIQRADRPKHDPSSLSLVQCQ